jgi:WD40 repeat protein
VTIWEVPSWKKDRVLQGHEGHVLGLAFDRKGELLATASADGTARLWRVASGEQLGLVRPGEGAVLAAALTPDGQVLATASRAGVKLWDTVSGKERVALAGPSTLCLAFSPDGKTLATGHGIRFRFPLGPDRDREIRGGEVRLYDVAGLLKRKG